MGYGIESDKMTWFSSPGTKTLGDFKIQFQNWYNLWFQYYALSVCSVVLGSTIAGLYVVYTQATFASNPLMTNWGDLLALIAETADTWHQVWSPESIFQAKKYTFFHVLESIVSFCTEFA